MIIQIEKTSAWILTFHIFAACSSHFCSIPSNDALATGTSMRHVLQAIHAEGNRSAWPTDKGTKDGSSDPSHHADLLGCGSCNVVVAVWADTCHWIRSKHPLVPHLMRDIYRSSMSLRLWWLLIIAWPRLSICLSA